MANPELAAQDYDLLARSLGVLTDDLNQAHDDIATLSGALQDIERTARVLRGRLTEPIYELDAILYVCQLPAVRAAMSAT